MIIYSIYVDNAMDMLYPLAIVLLCGCVVWAIIYCVAQADHTEGKNDDDQGLSC